MSVTNLELLELAENALYNLEKIKSLDGVDKVRVEVGIEQLKSIISALEKANDQL
jgi:cystathionine beta-lyase/cystathionine gamma-synthase